MPISLRGDGTSNFSAPINTAQDIIAGRDSTTARDSATSRHSNVTGVSTSNTLQVTANATVDGTATLNYADMSNARVGGAMTVVGNLSVGGILTYEDVTNVDSVGIITARTGIKVLSGGINAVGVVTATSFSGSGANLTDIQSGTANFVASGNIANNTVVIIKTDGTVGIITDTVSDTPTVGSPVVFESAAVNYVKATFDSNSNKVVIAYMDDANSDYGTAIVGTVSGNSISFGTPVVFASATTYTQGLTFDSNSNKVVIAYNDGGNSQHGTAIVGTVSGTSISFGSEVVFESAEIGYGSATFDSNSNKVVIAYKDLGNSQHGTAVVGTVSGTSISFGTPVVYESARSDYNSITFDSNSNKVVIAYQDNGNSSYGTAVVGTVSGTSISFGTPVVFNSAATYYCGTTFDSTNNKVVIGYYDGGNSNYGTAIVGTVSGTSISFGSEVVFVSAAPYYIDMTYDTTNNKVVAAYLDSGNSSQGTMISGVISGTSISFGTSAVFETGGITDSGIIFDPSNNRIVVAYKDHGNSDYGTAVVAKNLATNLTTENYIGIAAEAISNGATGKINIGGGINTGQTGLTTARKHFVQSDGTLATSADIPSVVAGTAISGTSIIVKG